MKFIQFFRHALNTSNILTLVTISVTGFILLVIFITVSYSFLLSDLEGVLLETELNSHKMQINSELMELARSRTRLTLQIIDLDDPFEQDELNMKLEMYAGRFASLRQKLRELSMTQDELNILDENNAIVPVILPAQRTAVEMAMTQEADDKKQAKQILYDAVLPGQGKMIEAFARLISIEQQRIAELASHSSSSLHDLKRDNAVIIISAILLANMFSIYILRRIRNIQRDLRHSTQQLEESNVNLELKIKERTRELSELNTKLKQVSEHDELTNIYNRRKFNEFIANEYARTNRIGSCFALILIDIDSFKKYNDNYGHQQGDQCLASVASTMSLNLPRSVDFIARYGGEEFVVVLPSTELEGAKKVAEQLRQSVLALDIPHEYSEAAPCVTVSLGAAIYHAHDSVEISDIIEQADQCLYAAKSKGRNRLVSMG